MISYFDFAQKILSGGELESKLLDQEVIWDDYRPYQLPRLPGRAQQIAFSDKQLKFPKPASLREDEKKAIALHSFANHELLAIEMMAAALLIYPHADDDSIRFKRGILSALRDEQKHLQLYINRLQELGHGFGDFPLNDFFWRQMEKLTNPAQYSAVMSMTFEAANLDFACFYARLFRSYGDEQTASVLETVLEDEISHVAFGAHWMKRWKQQDDLWTFYQASLPWPLTPARSKGIEFSAELRRQAGMDENFLTALMTYEDDFRITRRGL
jgi:uncharacterized ferritin-like protein (DUF455 family)